MQKHIQVLSERSEERGLPSFAGRPGRRAQTGAEAKGILQSLK